MRVLFCGDIVGRAGRDIVVQKIPVLRKELSLDFVVVNGENAAAGFGITPLICKELYQSGVDLITTGNHIWGQKDIIPYLDQEERLIRPLNFPKGTPGRGLSVIKSPRGSLVVVNVMGRVFMDPLDDPFSTMDQALIPYRVSQVPIIVDIHAEASSEKQAMGHYLDGRVSAVFGTHTHVPTADAKILLQGTAYQTDVGMCGDYDSIIGMQPQGALWKFTKKIPGPRLTPSEGPGTLCGTWVEINQEGKSVSINPIKIMA